MGCSSSSHVDARTKANLTVRLSDPSGAARNTFQAQPPDEDLAWLLGYNLTELAGATEAMLADCAA
jgi:hypothetical protein